MVPLSTTEAEYMAITETVKEVIWLQGLLGELGIDQKYVIVHCDSQSAIQLAKNQVYHARMKHIDVRYHFVAEIVEEGGVKIQKIRTAKNPADMLTKVVSAIKFKIRFGLDQPCQNLKVELELLHRLVERKFTKVEICRKA
ncbi:UNVERIFIED_CONTAM: Retrovirus-related Pol polyprotein from transposon TNT 1-94 [Sesamum radiatum]|uniref:Retrovirus-related Pol polyprotein from transposon TNT 1-94 n=1 Tax=Sesamum radiatum TaxID=300843 RepID=A0AAW2VME4_SESRA